MSLVDHFEDVLGTVQLGWSADADGREMPFEVLQMAHASSPETVSFATLGLSRYPLKSKVSNKEIRHELLTLAPASLRDGPIPGLLMQAARYALMRNRALLRGEVLRPRGPLVPGSRMEGFFVAAPVYFPDEFAVVREGGHIVVIAWLVPIATAEAGFILEYGSEAFEKRLDRWNPDLTDWYRESIV